MSPFPQYRSKALTALMRQFDSLRDRTQAIIRHAQMIGRWSIEAALYPIYRWEQVRKTINRQIGQTFHSITQALAPAQSSEKKAIHASEPIENLLASIEVIPASPELREAPVINLAKTDNANIQPRKNWIQEGFVKLRQISHFLIPTFQRKVPENKSSQSSLDNLPGALTQSKYRAPIRWIRGRLETVRTGVIKFVNRQFGLNSAPHPNAILKVQAVTQQTKIQGIATRLSNKHLVFVTPSQEILDILTPSQQSILRQKINWAIHRYSIRFRLHQARKRLAQGLEQLTSYQSFIPLPGPIKALFRPQSVSARQILTRQTLTVSRLPVQQDQGSLLPIRKSDRRIPKLGKWVIQGIIGAIAALPFVAIPALAAESAPQPTVLETIKPQWIDPNHLKTQLSWDELQGMTSQHTQSHTWLAHSPRTSRKSTSPQNTSPQNTALSDTPRSTTVNQSFYTPDNGIEIPIEAEFLGYETHLLERIIGWIDVFLVQVETAIAIIWKWLGLIILASMAIIQKMLQIIFD